MDRSSRQKINKKIKALNDTLDITDIFRTFHPQNTEYTFFSSAHGTFSRTDHISGSQIRSQLVPNDWDNSLHIFRPQCFETRTPSQEKSWKELKYMETKEYLTKE